VARFILILGLTCAAASTALAGAAPRSRLQGPPERLSVSQWSLLRADPSTGEPSLELRARDGTFSGAPVSPRVDLAGAEAYVKAGEDCRWVAAAERGTYYPRTGDVVLEAGDHSVVVRRFQWDRGKSAGPAAPPPDAAGALSVTTLATSVLFLERNRLRTDKPVSGTMDVSGRCAMTLDAKGMSMSLGRGAPDMRIRLDSNVSVVMHGAANPLARPSARGGPAPESIDTVIAGRAPADVDYVSTPRRLTVRVDGPADSLADGERTVTCTRGGLAISADRAVAEAGPIDGQTAGRGSMDVRSIRASGAVRMTGACEAAADSAVFLDDAWTLDGGASLQRKDLLFSGDVITLQYDSSAGILRLARAVGNARVSNGRTTLHAREAVWRDESQKLELVASPDQPITLSTETGRGILDAKLEGDRLFYNRTSGEITRPDGTAVAIKGELRRK
jgi:hypothetical protein